MKSFMHEFSSDSCRRRGATLFNRIVFSAQIFLQDFHKIDAIYDILSMCNCRQFCPRSGILYDCSLFIQELLAYAIRKGVFPH